MTEIGINTPDINPLFAVYDKPNPIELSHQRALAYQAILRSWELETDSEELDELVNQAIAELDTDLGCVNEQIQVTGNVIVKSARVNGIDEEDGSFERSSVTETRDFYDYKPLQSLGYTIDRDSETEMLTISHLATTDLEVVSTDIKFGDVLKRKRVYIPLDGTAHVEPEKDPNEYQLDLLEYHIPELLTDVDIALLNGENLSESLQRLGEIDLSPYDVLDKNEDVALTLGRYINASLEISRSTPYTISGADTIRILGDNGEFQEGEIDTSLEMIGNIIGTAVTYKMNRLAIITSMPFENSSQRIVLYNLNDTITIKENPVFSF